ncbi:MAG: hypothetical protein WDN28_01690 [Chthoniobacter sp.]
MGAIKFWYEHSLATPEQLAEKKKYDEEVKAKERGDHRGLDQGAERSASHLAAPGGGLPRGRPVLLPDEAKLADAEPVAKESQLDAGILLTCRRYLDQHPEPSDLCPVARISRGERSRRGAPIL